MTVFEQTQLEKMTPEQYSYFLAHGSLEDYEELNEDEYERYLKSHLIYDL
ncbi:hypothetical protein CYYG_00002 [Cyanophage SS120-1]|uniref:Uncharacterized protein n=1 Tax=Cyanophage SS120-1 TaxID=616674 RepID=M1TVQ1_9CAUD|nr:hypothetical protein CYYG_00002 [Cyanophage SS120-1]AGG54504.1 hypothetical protein CYYG_00002 [Cyanophage SS120-1]